MEHTESEIQAAAELLEHESKGWTLKSNLEHMTMGDVDTEEDVWPLMASIGVVELREAAIELLTKIKGK